jgi:RecG-like helicase
VSPATPIERIRWRDTATIEGTVRSLRARPWAEGASTLECTVLDDTGGVEIVFLGRSAVPGIHLGTRLRARGRVGAHHRRLAILNPEYELFAD